MSSVTQMPPSVPMLIDLVESYKEEWLLSGQHERAIWSRVIKDLDEAKNKLMGKENERSS